MYPWFGPRSITWALVRNVHSQSAPQTYWNQEVYGMQFSNLHFNKPSSWLWYMLTFDNCWSKHGEPPAQSFLFLTLLSSSSSSPRSSHFMSTQNVASFSLYVFISKRNGDGGGGVTWNRVCDTIPWMHNVTVRIGSPGVLSWSKPWDDYSGCHKLLKCSISLKKFSHILSCNHAIIIHNYQLKEFSSKTVYNFYFILFVYTTAFIK